LLFCSAIRVAPSGKLFFKFSRSDFIWSRVKYIKRPSAIKTGFAELDRLVSETSEQHACLEMRKRFHAYSKGIQNGGELRKAIVHASTVKDYHDIFDGILKGEENI